MKHVGNAYCYKIKGLFVPYETPATIEADINDYINKIERLTERLENEFNNKKTSDFIETLELIQDKLQKVHATQCESHVAALLNAAKTRGIEYCEKFMQQALADFLLLSIEMQKAQKLPMTTSYVPIYNEIEKHEDSARNLSAVVRLINAGEYTKAQSIATSMKDKEDGFNKLTKMFDDHSYDKAKELAKDMEKKHIDRIKARKGDGAAGAMAVKMVLAVDDRPEILTSVNSALSGHYKVFGATGGKQALQIAAQHEIDFFILDIDMPEMDGFELAGHIRSNPKYAKTPLVFLTATSSKERISRAISLGSNDFIVKPAFNVTLLAKARRFID